MGYNEIKAMAKTQKVKVDDLLVLAQQNDPFYTGSPGRLEKAEWFAKVYKDMGSPRNVHIRRIHYALVVRGDIEKPPDRSGRKSKGNSKPLEPKICGYIEPWKAF